METLVSSDPISTLTPFRSSAVPASFSSFAAALSPLYRLVKVVPALPRSKSFHRARLNFDCGRREKSASVETTPRTKVGFYQPTQTKMTYIQEFEAELVKELQSSEEPAAVVRWVSEKVLKCYRNSISTGQKRAQVIRKSCGIQCSCRC